MPKNAMPTVWTTIVIIFLLIFVESILVSQTTETVSYSEFQRLLSEGKVAAVAVSEHSIQADLKAALPSGRSHVITQRVDADMVNALSQYGVTFKGVSEDTWYVRVLNWVIPALLFGVIWMVLMGRMSGQTGLGLRTLGRNKAKVYVERETKVAFADVAGVDEAKRELQEVVAFLKDPNAYTRLGAHMPKGILLIGPPGTGKTLMARAVAGEAGVPFFSISGSEFVEMFVGLGAARVRDLFEQARSSAPCIIFIDELDALGRSRAVGPATGGSDEKEQTLNQLLVELDGFDARNGIVLLAATNRPEILDPALLRAGRFDRQVMLDRPDKGGRLAILKIHVGRLSLAPDVDLDQIAGMTIGFSGADLANLANEAALVATRRSADAVTTEDFTVAFERIVGGIEKKSRVLSAHERQVVAHHEMGHALVGMALGGREAVQKVSIIPRGVGAIGYTLQRPTEERYLATRQELLDKLAMLLAGRAAEVMVFKDLSTGAGDDLAKATDIARSMVMEFGMDEVLGQVAYEPRRGIFLDQRLETPRHFSEATAREIDCAVRSIIANAVERATCILKSNRSLLEESAAQLIAKETLTEETLKALKAKIDLGAVSDGRAAA